MTVRTVTRTDPLVLAPPDVEFLRPFALKYLWWKTPEEALESPRRIIAQVMDIGDYDDVQAIANRLGDEVLRATIENAEAGHFSARSWHYWHYRLKLAELGKVPNLPTRTFGTAPAGS
jgi:hypothetical protein